MKKLCMLLMVGMALSVGANAQAEPKAKKYENAKWVRISMIDFHSGKMGRAMEIVEKYFMKASDKAGTPGPSMRLDVETGEWDLIVVWDMAEGPEAMNWEISPDQIKWKKALDEIAGSGEKANALWSEYQSLIARSSSYIARVL